MTTYSAHSVNFVHLNCRCEMSCMSGNTDCGGPNFCILNTATYVGKIMKTNFAKKSPKVDFLRELVTCTYMFTMATSPERCLVEGGDRIREG